MNAKGRTPALSWANVAQQRSERLAFALAQPYALLMCGLQNPQREPPAIERLLRSMWFWFSFPVLSYLISLSWLVPQLSHFWYGKPVYILILAAPVFAPQGLLTLFGVGLGYPHFWYFLIGAHGVFWSSFGAFVVCLKRLKPTTLYSVSALILLIVIATLAGCSRQNPQTFDL
jgi:hypothetical protein